MTKFLHGPWFGDPALANKLRIVLMVVANHAKFVFS